MHRLTEDSQALRSGRVAISKRFHFPLGGLQALQLGHALFSVWSCA